MQTEQFRLFNCYSILDVSPDAGPQEIRSAWRNVSMKTHPDRGGSNEAQQRVNIAYEVLSDPIQRRQHDIHWKIAKPRKTAESPSQEQPNRARQQSTHSTARPREDALNAFQRRLDAAIKTRKAEIWSELSARTDVRFGELKRQFQEQRKSAALWAGAAAAGASLIVWKPTLWIVGVIPIFVLAFKMFTLGAKFRLFETVSDETIRRLAHEATAASCHLEATQLDKFGGYFVSILDLALRPSSFDDSETHVARRLVVSFFLSGYLPEGYDAQNRIFLFADGDERIAVRFRHRSGAAVNITYLKGLHERLGRGVKGMLFCSPGLSGNAASYATQHGIRWYTLDTMNRWIDDMLREGAIGPRGDVLKHIEYLSQFLARITPTVGFSKQRSRFRRRYR